MFKTAEIRSQTRSSALNLDQNERESSREPYPEHCFQISKGIQQGSSGENTIESMHSVLTKQSI
jgi:hypothetical protein